MIKSLLNQADAGTAVAVAPIADESPPPVASCYSDSICRTLVVITSPLIISLVNNTDCAPASTTSNDDETANFKYRNFLFIFCVLFL